MQGIYRIANKVNGKYYIGNSKDIGKRWDEHREILEQGKHYNSYLQRAWNKYGKENFNFEYVEEVQGGRVSLLAREQEYLDEGFEQGMLYNVAEKAGGGDLGKEARQKISVAMAGENNPLYGKHRTNETKAKIRVANKKYYETHDGYWKGKRRAEETNAKISKTLTGSKLSEETKAKISKGVSNPSRETREKISQALTGHKVSKETRAKISNANAKPYPAFYNVKTEKFIPAGHNLAKMCRTYALAYGMFAELRLGIKRQSCVGWRLARNDELMREGR